LAEEDELVAAGVIFPPRNVGGEKTVEDLPELPHFMLVRPLGSDSIFAPVDRN
jgi:hypothetical protein